MILFRKLSFWLALLGIASAVQLTFVTQAQINEPRPPPPVAPATKPFPRGIGASGLVEARRENTLVGVPQAGLIAQVHVAVWDRVEAGAPLLQLDDRELRAALLAQRAQITVAEATLKRITTQLARVATLHATGAVTDDDLQTRRDDAAIAEAQLAAARAVVTQTETLLERLTVRAPIAGTVLQVNIRAGEYASPTAAASNAPVVLGNIDEVQVRADVDEQIAPRVKAGKRAIGFLKGDTTDPIEMAFVRIEPFVVPKRALTGASTERVDTRVLQVIFKFPNTLARPVYVGQQLDLFIEE